MFQVVGPLHFYCDPSSWNSDTSGTLNVFLFQLKRYRGLKELVHQQGAGLSQQAEKMNWEVKSDQEKIVFDQRRKKELEVQSIPIMRSPKIVK